MLLQADRLRAALRQVPAASAVPRPVVLRQAASAVLSRVVRRPAVLLRVVSVVLLQAVLRLAWAVLSRVHSLALRGQVPAPTARRPVWHPSLAWLPAG